MLLSLGSAYAAQRRAHILAKDAICDALCNHGLLMLLRMRDPRLVSKGMLVEGTSFAAVFPRFFVDRGAAKLVEDKQRIFLDLSLLDPF